MPVDQNKLQAQKIVLAMKMHHKKSKDEYRQFLRFAIELVEVYGYSLTEIEKIIGEKV